MIQRYEVKLTTYCIFFQDGYFSLDAGCRPCDCNIAASTSTVCDKDSPDGQCPCLPNVDSPTCTLPFPGYYFRHLDNELFEAEEAELSEVHKVYIAASFSHCKFAFL